MRSMTNSKEQSFLKQKSLHSNKEDSLIHKEALYKPSHHRSGSSDRDHMMASNRGKRE